MKLRFEKEQNGSSSVIMLRWCAFLPLALLSAIGFRFAMFSLFDSFVGDEEESMISPLYFQSICSFFIGFIIVWVGVKIAPAQKGLVSVVLFAFIALALVFFVLTSWQSSNIIWVVSYIPALAGAYISMGYESR